MKKIVLDETQADKLMNKLVSEQITDNNRYSQEVTCSFDYHNLKWGDNPNSNDVVDWIPDVKFNVSFTIDMEGRSYGIKGITIGDVRGPEEIDIEVSVMHEGSEDPELYPYVILKPDWYGRVTIENDANIGWIGIDQDIEMALIPTEAQGSKLSVGKIIVHSKEI